jgi:hypothetical protein
MVIDGSGGLRFEVNEREMIVRASLSREEMNVQFSDDDGVLVVAGEYDNHAVRFRSWVAHPQGRPSPAPQQEERPLEPEPARRYVQHEQMHWGAQALALQDSFPHPEFLSGDQLEAAFVGALSDVLCGVNARGALEHRLGGADMDYATAVVDFPGDELQRRGTMLLSVFNADPFPALYVRVIGESRSYTGSHQYDGAATAEAADAGETREEGAWIRDYWVQHIDVFACSVAAKVIAGAPATHAFPEGLVGKRGPQASTFREWRREVELSGLERMVAAQLIGLVDLQNAAFEELRWAESGPIVWDGIGALQDQRRDAEHKELALLEELERVGALDPGRDWIFRPEVPFDTVRNDMHVW